MQAEQVKKVEIYYVIPAKTKEARSVSVSNTSNLASIIEAIKAKNNNFLGDVDDVDIEVQWRDEILSSKPALRASTKAEIISAFQAHWVEKDTDDDLIICALQITIAAAQQQQVQLNDQFLGNIKKALKEAIKEEAEEGSMVSFSRVSVGGFNSTLSRYGITVDVHKTTILGTRGDHNGFTWSGSKEDAQSDHYKNWINQHLIQNQSGLFVKTRSSKGQYLKFKGRCYHDIKCRRSYFTICLCDLGVKETD
eukprot:c21577_g1_i3.p1 GENE.c21577_g1_i3~~c21577_g1_i3.p1  ORF type:complete len:274 (-),score=16.26 c21577_g1_i3:658-1410(-)